MLISFVTPVSAQEAFIIDDANVNMVVHENGTLDITEKFDLDFSAFRHGFFRYIPTKYQMDWTVNGKKENRQYYFPVKNITCSTACSIETNSKYVKIKLGDEDKEIIGKHQYTISYTVDTKDLGISSKEQVLYWNLLGDFDTTIKHFSYRIEMPKSFDAKNVYTYSGRYGMGDDNLTHNVDGNTISGSTQRMLSNNELATIRVNLPKDYFTYPKPKDYSMWALGAGIIILIVSGLLFLKFGKDDDVIVTVEFKAPDDLDSASVGYVIDNSVENRDILSLIIDWANRGFLLIHDEKDGFRLEKLKDMDKGNSHGYERVFFNAIFKDCDIVDEGNLKNGNIGTALVNAKQMLKHSFNRNPKKRVYSSTSLGLQALMVILIVIPSTILSLSTAYAKYEMIEVAGTYMIPSIILVITCVPWMILMQKRYVMKKTSFFIACFALLFINGIVVAINSILQLFLGANILIVIVIAIITLLLLIIMLFMDKRTKQGNRWLGQILGLKEFIISCEKDQIEMLANESPSAFFDVLPYAYVLGVSDVWVKKFENIVIPEPSWYQGLGCGNGNVFMTMLWWNNFNYCFHNISSAATYIPPSTSGVGGGSFGGGGGFGGGGFSGGGFGGGGGGSW